MSVVAATIADVHLSHKAPKFRRAEPNWYAAQARTLDQVRAVVEEFQCPLVVAGDLFDSGWKPHHTPPELLNFALKYLPPCYGICGQHDLPHHRLADVERSAYWTLVEARLVKDLPPGEAVSVGGVVLYGFPWGVPLRPREVTQDLAVHVAVVHAYVWGDDTTAHPGASLDTHASVCDLSGYDVGVFGDNHRPFIHEFGDPSKSSPRTVINCGTLLVRKADEVGTVPSVGLIHSDGTVTRRYLDVSQDKYSDEPSLAKGSANAEGIASFVGELSGLTSRPMFDFRDAVQEYLRTHEVSGAAARILTRLMGETK